MNEWIIRTLIAVVGALLGGCITAAILYVTIVGTYVSKTEVRQLISLESPYLRDQKWLTETVRSFDTRLQRVDEKLDMILSRLPILKPNP